MEKVAFLYFALPFGQADLIYTGGSICTLRSANPVMSL